MFSAIFFAVAPRPTPFWPPPEPEEGELPACAGLSVAARAVGEIPADCGGETRRKEGAGATGVMFAGRRGASVMRVEVVLSAAAVRGVFESFSSAFGILLNHG